MKHMYKELFLFKWALLLLFITVVGSVAANLALPMYLSEVINTAIPNGDKVQVVSIGGAMLLFVLLGVVCSVGTGFFASLASVGFGKIVRSKIFRKVQFYSQTEFDGFSTSSLITRTNNDVVQVQTFMNMLLKVCLMAPIMCIGGVVLALAKSATMSMILIISLPVMIAFVLIIARLASPLSRKMQEKLDEINLVTREKLTGIRVARAFGTEQFEEQRFHRVNDEFMLNTIRMNSIMGIMIPGLSLILYATMVALIAFGGYQIINIHTAIPIGDIIAVIQYVMQIMMSVMMLSMIFVMYPRAAVSAGRINEVLETLPAVSGRDDGVTETDRRGYVSFRDVTFTFPHAEAPAIEHISFDSAPGEVTAIIGSTGSGKSTLVSCVNQELPYTGEITFSDRNLAVMTLRERAQLISILPQTLHSPAVTVEELTAFGRNPYLDFGKRMSPKDWQAVDDALEAIGISGLRDKLVTELSGGERQKAYLAMVLAQNTRVMILDEPTTYMDMEYEAAFFRLLETLKTKRKITFLVIMHNLSQAVRYADRIVVLDGRRIRYQGDTRACVASGVLESVFHVRQHQAEDNGEKFIFFT